MTRISLVTLISAGLTLGAVTASAQQPRAGGPGPTPNRADSAKQEQAEPMPVALSVGALEIAADSRLALSRMAIDIAADKTVYTYQFKNTGTVAIDLAASVAMPTLEASEDDSEIWTLPVREAENPVGLKVSVGDSVISAKPHITATALGINRLADIRAARLPLIPVGKRLEKTLRELAPDAAASLAQIGLISPRDPNKPDASIKAAWSLDVTHAFQVPIPAGATTPVTVAFSPVKAEYAIGKGDEEGLDDLKDDYCVSAKVLGTLRSRLKSGGKWQITELALDTNGPSHWIETPAVSLAVRKPRQDAIVAFCGLNEKVPSADVATGTVPEKNEDGEVRIMIFTPDGR